MKVIGHIDMDAFYTQGKLQQQQQHVCMATDTSTLLCVLGVQLRLGETQAGLLDSLWWSSSTTR